MDKKEEFQKRMIQTFLIEADENINLMITCLMEMEKNADAVGQDTIESIYRAAHSLKGAARAVGFLDIERLCHAFEDMLAALKGEEIKAGPAVFDAGHRTVDILQDVLNKGDLSIEIQDEISQHIDHLSMVAIGAEPDPLPQKIKAEKVEEPFKETKVQIETPIKSEAQKEVNVEVPKMPVQSNGIGSEPKKQETLRISTEKLDNLLIQAEELISVNQSMDHIHEGLGRLNKQVEGWNRKFATVSLTVSKVLSSLNGKNVDLDEIDDDDLVKSLQFLKWSVGYMQLLERGVRHYDKIIKLESVQSRQKINNLITDVKTIITLPISIILDMFPKMVRDISRDLGKNVDLDIHGKDIEIDKRILEELKIPLMHIIRNCIDYGIEDPETREKNGKEKAGKLKLDVERFQDNTVEITISDDGRGINKEKLRKLYSERYNLSEKEQANIDEETLLNFIFQSGVSTNDIVTDISGRGLGLAIVQETIDKLGGNITVESVEGKSTVFKIKLPVVIISSKGIVVESGKKKFMIPTDRVVKVLQIPESTVRNIEGRNTIVFDDEIIPITGLCDLFDIQFDKKDSKNITVVVMKARQKHFGIIVGNIVDEREVIVKKFNKQLKHVRNIAGVAVLGHGVMAPILEVSDIYKGMYGIRTSGESTNGQADGTNAESKKLLVVEDSITSRTLVKNILETAGYLVTTAVDGLDGYTKFKENEFNAIVSDVEMPKMSGFELTEKVRKDENKSDTPVVLVTSLSKPEHMEKGVEVGANAYIVKSGFDQTNLLETLERLI